MVRDKRTQVTLLTLFLVAAIWGGLPVEICAQDLSLANQEETEAESEAERLFKKAMKDRDEGRLKSSITAFHDILSDDPMLHRARLELAVAYYKQLQYEQAIKQAKKVAEDPKIPQNVRISILAFIAQAEKGHKATGKKSEWRFPVYMSSIIDDNVNVGPSSNILPNGFILSSPGTLPQSDTGLELSVGLNNFYQTGKTFNLFSKPAHILFLSGFNLFNRNYFNEDTDMGVLSFKVGPALIVPKHWRALLNFQWDRITYAGSTLADYYTARPSITYHFPHRMEATVDMDMSKRQYIGSRNETRDNSYVAPRILLGYSTADEQFSLQLSGQYFNENADAARYTNDGTNLSFGVTWNFFERSSVYGNYSRKDVKYEGFETSFTEKRDEVQHRYVVGVSHKISSENTFIDNWSIGLKATLTKNNSNIVTTDYRRNQYSLTFSKTF